MTSLASLAWRYLWARPLVSALNLLLLSLGLAAISFVLLVSEQIEGGVRRDLAGIDLVVGAKGSPMQIMLAGVFHLDVPTGNIPLATLDALRAQPLVARAVPISLGDSLRGFRIVGTTPDYLELYQARLAAGQLWQQPLQAVLGAEAARRTGLKLGDRFAGSHGLGEQGHEHGEHRYTVVGLLAETGGVLDRLVLTDLASVWQVHEDMHAVDAEDRAALEAEREITMALLSYRSPLAAIALPRWVNAQDGLQAAAPALETARLLRMVGVGTEVLRGFGAVLLLAAALSVFVALLHAVRERQGDLAMLRMLGAPAWRVAALVSLEGLWLALLASVLGLALGHGLTALLGWVLASQQSLHISGSGWSAWEALVPALALLLALASAAWPAWRAYKLDVTELLQALIEPSNQRNAMNNKHLVLAAFWLAAGLSGAAQAQSKPAPAKPALSEHAKKDIERHRAMSKAHEDAARCLESGETEERCQKTLLAACRGLAIGKYCGLKHEH